MINLRAHLPQLAGLAAFALLFIAAAARYSGQNFLSAGAIVNLLADQAVLGVIAAGVTVVIISGGIDLSVGAVMGTSSILTAVLITRHGWPALPAMGATWLAGAAFGALMGATIEKSRLPAFIVTLAGMFIARGGGFLISLEPVTIDAPSHKALTAISIPIGPAEIRLGPVVLLLVVVGLLAMLRFTVLGRWVYALGGSEEACRLANVPILKVRTAIYATSGFCAALAGSLLTLYLASGNQAEGVGLELDAIAATVIGGTLLTGGAGSVLGTLVGTLVIGLIAVSVTSYEGLSAGLVRVVTGGLLLGFVVLSRFMGGRRVG